MDTQCILYTKSDCKFCILVKNIFNTPRIDYRIVSLDDPITRAEFIENYPGVKSLPYLVLPDGRGLFYHEIDAAWKTFQNDYSKVGFLEVLLACPARKITA